MYFQFKFMVKIFGDTIIWWISILLFLTSILLVYSSGGGESIKSHLPHVIMGLGLVFIFSRFNYKYFTNLSMLLLIFSALMLLYLILTPSYKEGVMASRWIRLSFFSFQPSELAKYTLILFLSRNLFLYKDIIHSFKSTFFYIIFPTIIICLLILPSNLSTVILIVSIVYFLVFISGFPLKLFFKYLILPLIIVFTTFFSFLCLPSINVIDKVLPRLTTWKNRVCVKEFDKAPLRWVDCTQYNPSEIYTNNYQINKALGAINRGGFFGSGAGNSYYKKLLPESKSDFIFAILLEEYGLLGGAIVLLLYLIFYQRILMLSIKSTIDFPRLVLLGLGTIILLQALLHMSVSVNLIPVTGQTLPLVSKGGSSLWVTSLAFGIILNISHQINNQE